VVKGRNVPGKRRAAKPWPRYTPSPTANWLLAVPQALVGAKAEIFDPAGWTFEMHGPAGEWGSGDRYGWNIRDSSADKTALVWTAKGQYSSYNIPTWHRRFVPQSGDTWLMFARTVGCTEGRDCSWADWYEPEQAGALPRVEHTSWRCPMVVFEPGVWKRVDQFTR
jgi:hypothetical protein